MPPSCWSRWPRSKATRTSAIFPSRMWKMSMPGTATWRSLSSIPRNSVLWVPVQVNRIATLGPLREEVVDLEVHVREDLEEDREELLHLLRAVGLAVRDDRRVVEGDVVGEELVDVVHVLLVGELVEVAHRDGLHLVERHLGHVRLRRKWAAARRRSCSAAGWSGRTDGGTSRSRRSGHRRHDPPGRG